MSDESTDSFFEEPKHKDKRSIPTTPIKKPPIESTDDALPQDIKKKDWLGLGDDEENLEEPTKTIKEKTQILKANKKISFEDDDLLSTLGIDKKSAKAEPAKKNSLMESILGSSKQSSLDETKMIKSERPPSPAIKVGTPKVEGTFNLGYSISDGIREGRRSRHAISNVGVSDPLGLFSKDEFDLNIIKKDAPILKREGDVGTSESDVLFSDLKTRSVPHLPSNSLPNWLGSNKSDTVLIKPPPNEVLRRSSVPNTEEVEIKEDNLSTIDNPLLESLVTQQKLATTNIGYQNTAVALQQQESQLLVALQLKKYEENLSEMQKKQQDVLTKQEQQFNSLLERQFAKQQIMENNLRLQQDRINNHIQLLISQPPVSGRAAPDEENEVIQLKISNSEENSKLYEEMISTLKQRQHEEIFLLNESYKKQISLLEDSMGAIESRLKTEFNNLSQQFQTTVQNTKKEHELEIENYKQKIQEMAMSHSNEIKAMRETNDRIVDEIKYEYSTMIENIKLVKQKESSSLENALSYTEKLDDTLDLLNLNSKTLNEMRGKVQNDYNVLSKAREESLKVKEEELRLMRETLEKARETADSERAQLMALVRSLETKLMEQNQNSREDRWTLQQAASILSARTAAFDREIEFTRNSLEREREQLKTLKESLLAEQEKVFLQLTEEKLALSAEKSKLTTTIKLNQNYDSQRAKTEVDAAILVAKEAAELTDRERKNLHRQQSEIESLKRNLLDKEEKLMLKENELHELFATAERKGRDGERALAEAKLLEAKFNARLKDIQGQLISLTNREKKLVEEKIAVSKERVALHNLKQVKKCSLCTAENLQTDGFSYPIDQEFSPRTFNITDPDVLRLRYEITEERLISSEVDENSKKEN